nr:hypothetical protein [uncultured Flavobacterium sp.]
MKKIITSLLFVLISATAFSQAKATTFSESGFSAQFPTAPTVQKQNIETPAGLLPMTVYVCDAGDYMIMLSENSFSDEAAEGLKKSGSAALLKGSKDGSLNSFAKQMGGEFKPTKEENYMFNNKYSALKVDGSINEVAINANYILKDNRLYQIILIGDISSAEANNFMTTFKLIE